MKQIKIPLYACLIILLLLGVAAVKSLFNKPVILHNVERIVQIKDDSIDYWRDRYGTEHAQKLMANAELAVLHTAYGPLLDTVLKTLKINKNQLEQLTAIGLGSSGSVRLRVDTVFVDSSANYRFSYSDRWIDLKGNIGQSSTLDYTTFDSLIITGYHKRSGFLGLGKKKTYIDAYSLNSHSRISGMQGVQILKERRKPWSIGPIAGYGWNGERWSPFVGVGVGYALVRF